MPAALLRACVGRPGCPNLVESGVCGDCAKARAAAKGKTHARGYGANWRAFKAWVIKRLIALGIAPVCGARLPGTRETTDSRCAVAGRLVNAGLHLDHIWPLSDLERLDPRLVCDPARVQILCAACHNAKTQREQEAGFV